MLWPGCSFSSILEILLKAAEKNLKRVSLHCLWKSKACVMVLTPPTPLRQLSDSSKDKKLKRLEWKSHYKDYFPHLCASVRKQIAFQHFINEPAASEQWPSDGSIVWNTESKALKCQKHDYDAIMWRLLVSPWVCRPTSMKNGLWMRLCFGLALQRTNV